ncbi:putative membrane protein [Campylobacter hyointestinalis subsp. lawsonii CCUG 27631]|uniref:hypothetical protein n=1 Tax=Campylobacter hyointestinalis TaxID=198 RepID=UPI0007C99456|nr:hypothetical protein [Campylobacter hyointestinalis]ANE33832.1 putative membrane protein [Campylobacter hyointestinalis subsp. lawsonii CCUG 27631]RAZ53678.1 hypothetical protein CHL10074_08945 [Campylobacter hyointestinalis subsp. lawsonii]RAZ62306.1 hypothetical protein CHL9767_08720 [Campylobacter hyointestinalis subsp. lawsonii]
MIKGIKSAIFWTFIYKFRKRLALILMLIFLVLISQFIYADVVEYLKLTKQEDIIGYALFAKWILSISCIFFAVYILFGLSKQKAQKPKPLKEDEDSKLSDREKRFINKKLRTKTEIIMGSKKDDR